MGCIGLALCKFSLKIYIHCSLLCRDNVPVIVLADWDLDAEMLDEEHMSGVMPVLFSDNPQASIAAIRANPVQAKEDVEALNKQYFIPEQVDLEEALKIVKKPRSGDGEFVFKSRNLERLLHAPSQGNNHILSK